MLLLLALLPALLHAVPVAAQGLAALLPAAAQGLAALLPPVPDITPFLGPNFEELVKAAAATCEVLPLELLFSRRYTLELPHLDLVEFTRSSRRQFRALEAPAHVRGAVLLYVPGWWNTPTDESSTAIVQALLKKNPRVLVLDTRLSFCRGYIDAASRVKAIAHLLYTLIKKLTQNGVPLESIHIIGFSLGAHVAGMTGKLVKKGMKKKLTRITALDPAKPCFARTTAYRLDKRDAKFVQVIHSSAGALGLEQPLGHADLYMNGVFSSQPECQERSFRLQCDHSQAWRMYSRSVEDATALRAQRCGSWDELAGGRCGGNATDLGYGCSEATRGMFLYRSPAPRATPPPRGPLDLLNPFSWFGR